MTRRPDTPDEPELPANPTRRDIAKATRPTAGDFARADTRSRILKGGDELVVKYPPLCQDNSERTGRGNRK